MVEWTAYDSTYVVTRNTSVRSDGFRAPEHPRAIGRRRPYTLDGILARDKISLDLFWLRDESLKDSANLPDPHVLAEELADELRSALEQTESVLGDLRERAQPKRVPLTDEIAN